jgi:hypothetical protein
MDRWQYHNVWETLLSCEDDSDSEENNMSVFQRKTHSPSIAISHSHISSSFSNPMYKLKSLLYPPKLSTNRNNYPLSNVLRCSSCMCDLDFWTNVYLSRTLNTPSPLVGLSVDIVKVSKEQTNTNTPNSASPADSIQGKFLYPQQQTSSNKSKYFSMGRDPTRELKVVELLLAAVSSSTRYQRHSHLPPVMSPSHHQTSKDIKSGEDRASEIIRRRQQSRVDAKRTFFKK